MRDLPSPAQLAFGVFVTVILLWWLGAYPPGVSPIFFLIFGGLLFVMVSIGTYIRGKERKP